jgi:hypothetical protein
MTVTDSARSSDEQMGNAKFGAKLPLRLLFTYFILYFHNDGTVQLSHILNYFIGNTFWM